MRIIIAGAGEVGFHLAKLFSEEGREVVLIDTDPNKISRIKESLDVQSFLGNSTSRQTLKKAGIEQAGIFIAVTNQDEVNIVACSLAHDLSPGIKKIARIRNPELANHDSENFRRLFPIDISINPDLEGAKQIAQMLQVPGALELVGYEGGKVLLVSYRIEPESPLAGKDLNTLADLDPERKVIVTAINRLGRVIIPSGADLIQSGDIVTMITIPSHLPKLFSLVGRKATTSVEKVMIFGATPGGVALARTLDKAGINVKLVDSSLENCEQVAALGLKRVMPLRGDPSDPEFLQAENVKNVQAFVAASRDDGDNILTALLAKRMGAPAAMVILSRSEYVNLANAVGLDGAISSRIAAANAISRLLRQGKVLSVVMMESEQAEAIEFVALETSDIVNRPLKKLNFPRGALVGAIIRGGNVIIPGGNDVINPGDRVIIFTLRKNIAKIEKFLTVKLEYFG